MTSQARKVQFAHERVEGTHRSTFKTELADYTGKENLNLVSRVGQIIISENLEYDRALEHVMTSANNSSMSGTFWYFVLRYIMRHHPKGGKA